MFETKFGSTAAAAALLVTAGAASAQGGPGPYTITGTGCAGESGTTAEIAGNGFPTVGGPGYTITVSGAAGAPVLLGVGATEIPGGFPLDGVGLPGCFLYTVPTTSLAGVTDGNGDAVFPAPAPTVPGANVLLQGYVADAGPSTLGATTELLSYTTLPASSSSGGELVITEFLRDPSTIFDSDGEWLEIYNPGVTPVDIEGYWLADDDFDLHQIDAGGAGVLVPAGGYAVLGANADPLVNGGITLDYQWAGYFLSNSTSAFGDEIRLLDPVGFDIDRISYNNPDGWPLLGGASASLDPGSLDAASNDDPANWCLNTTDLYDTTAGVNTGTPGTANPVCEDDPPSGEVGDIIITEVMQNPFALGDGDGEYFEVYNTTGSDIDMMGWTVSDLGSDSFVVSSSVVVPAGGYATFSNGMTPGFTPDFVYSGMFLSNSDDELVLTDMGGAKQDEILWDNGATFPDPNGASMNFDAAATQDATANNDGANWCEATAADAGYTSGDLGSPGAANETCTVAP
ncbi:MAG: lamin tail domain-containing protein [Planctomycetota bacterium]